MKWELAIKESLTLEAWNKREKGFINQKIETKISRLCTDADKTMEIKKQNYKYGGRRSKNIIAHTNCNLLKFFTRKQRK